MRQWGGAFPGGRAAAPLRLERETPSARVGARAGLRSSAIRRWAIFARYYLPTRTYHTLAKRDGIPKRRYVAAQPNQQWHIDFAETKLADGAHVVVVVLIDDYSRFCVCCQVVPAMSSEAALQRSKRRGRPSAARKSSSVTMAGPSRRFTPAA